LSSPRKTLIYQAKLFDGFDLHANGWLLFGDTIEQMGTGPTPAFDVDAIDRIDARNRLVSPPLLDTHVHGGGGFTAEDGGASMREVLAFHRRHGAGSSFLSIVSLPQHRILELITDAQALQQEDQRFLGVHIEGPFLAATHRGVHQEDYLRPPTDDEIQAIIDASGGVVRSMTVAPELLTDTHVDLLLNAGIHPCFGHTAADYDQARHHFDRGSRIVTHAFNAMNPIHHRQPGPILAAIEDERVWLELIADGIHVLESPAHLLPPSRVILVTDAMAAAGQPDGVYQLGDVSVTVSDSVARADNGSLAGSVLTLNQAVKRFADWTGDLAVALRSATSNPARAYGLDGVGTLAPGNTADLVMWSNDLEPDTRWLAGSTA
jgi:N-acetylglucosamine-6-phosphate deacetylase